MRDANYLRVQAELCLEIAREMSDQAAADNLREEAARYRAEADTIDPTDAYKRATLCFCGEPQMKVFTGIGYGLAIESVVALLVLAVLRMTGYV